MFHFYEVSCLMTIVSQWKKLMILLVSSFVNLSLFKMIFNQNKSHKESFVRRVKFLLIVPRSYDKTSSSKLLFIKLNKKKFLIAIQLIICLVKLLSFKFYFSILRAKRDTSVQTYHDYLTFNSGIFAININFVEIYFL